ncbi:hypothetical protein Tco_1017644 [Tanacetum coccineum]|uniref:Reverse transcriptase N-terminal domain-containing protein n=1 Tax=Tanacetum coccineum TaxID=301880 RepID=A0ABQ5FSI4_9ASTR
MINFKKKLQALKISIKQWSKYAKTSSYKVKISIQSNLSDIDKILGQGGSNEEILINHSLLLNKLHDITSIDSLEVAQKAKVRWAIEGDENTKYFHDILNNKRYQLAIRGVLVDGDWIVDPSVVKGVFFKHFSTQFPLPEFFESLSTISSLVHCLWSNKKTLNKSFLWKRLRGLFGIVVRINPQVLMASLLSFFVDIGKFWSRISWLLLWNASLQILANRLSFVISDLISDVQLAFVSDRQILNGSFILSELLSKLMRIGTRSEEVEAAARTLGCVTFSTPFVHLGVKVPSLWSRFFKAIYGEIGTLNSFISLSRRSPWLEIIREEDIWIDGSALKYRYPRLYALEMFKQISVAEKKLIIIPWLVRSFRRAPREGEEDNQCRLQSRIGDLILAQTYQDRCGICFSYLLCVPYGSSIVEENYALVGA